MRWRRSTEEGMGVRGTSHGLPVRERFYLHTRRDLMTGCLEWTGSIMGGYGQFVFRDGADKTIQRAHRVAWFIEFSTWPVGHLHHLCLNRKCVELTHLVDLSASEHIHLAHSANHPGARLRQESAPTGPLRLIAALKSIPEDDSIA